MEHGHESFFVGRCTRHWIHLQNLRSWMIKAFRRTMFVSDSMLMSTTLQALSWALFTLENSQRCLGRWSFNMTLVYLSPSQDLAPDKKV